jgi:hypothetical protein
VLPSNVNPFRLWYIWVLFHRINRMFLEQKNTFISEIEIKFNEIKTFCQDDINIFGNDLKYFKNTFENFLNLETISIRSSTIHTVTIHQKTFKGLVNLKYLIINSYHLREIENGTFDGLRSLKELHLTTVTQGSNLNLIKDYLFIDLVNLEKLNLSYNQIGSIEENTFKNLINLKELYLNNNKIIIIHTNAFQYLINLEILNLSNNQIGSIEENTFKNLINLKELYLNNNKIMTIHKNAFQNLNKMNLIRLENNPVFENWVVPKRYLLRYLIMVFIKLKLPSILSLIHLICLVGFNVTFSNYFGFFDLIMLLYRSFSLFTLVIVHENHYKKIRRYRSNFRDQNYLHRLFIFYLMEPFKNRLFLYCFLMYLTLVILNSYLNVFYITFIYWSFISNIVFLSFFYDIKFYRLNFIYPFTEFEIDEYLNFFFHLNAYISVYYLIIYLIFLLLFSLSILSVYPSLPDFYHELQVGSIIILVTFLRIND